MYILYVLSFFFFFFFYSVDIVDDNVNIVDEEPHFVGYSAINHYYYYYYYYYYYCYQVPNEKFISAKQAEHWKIFHM